MARTPIETYFFAVTVVRSGEKFLMVHERKHGQLWYLPAGAVEPGETLIAAAKRETLEETGIPVSIDGIIRIEYTPGKDNKARMRVIFLAHPLDDTPPKQEPDHESLGAAWVTLEQLSDLPLRGPDVPHLFAYVADGGAVYPLSLLAREGQAYPETNPSGQSESPGQSQSDGA